MTNVAKEAVVGPEYACLCDRNTPDCEVCARRAREEWLAYQAEYPQDTPGQLIQRAIQDDRPYVVLGILQNTDLDVNAPCEPERYGSPSPLALALQADAPRLVALMARRPGLDLRRALPPDDAWTWAESCSLEVLQIVVDLLGGDVNRQDGYGRTLLHAVVMDTASPDKLAFLLRQDGIDVDVRQADNTTPLYRAALAGNLAAVEELLQHPVDVNNHNTGNDWTVLMAAVAGDHTAIVEALLRRPQVEVNTRSDLQETALHLAAENGHERAVELLLGHPAIDVNARDHLGWTALTTAAFGNHIAVVRLLLSRPELEMNFVDQDRQTALYWAAAAGHLEIVGLLLQDPRVNAYITNRPAHETAYDIAAARGFTDIAAALRAWMDNHAGDDVLSPDDPYTGERPAEGPVLHQKPLIPEPPDLRDGWTE